MPAVLITSECRKDGDGHALPSVPVRGWLFWAQPVGRPHAQRSPRTPRPCALTSPQTMETLLESVARQSPFLYSQAGAGL
jgi:hypothetical protein